MVFGYTDAMSSASMLPSSSSSPPAGVSNIGRSVNVLITAAGATLMVVGFVAFGLWVCGRCSARSAAAAAEAANDPPAAAKAGLSKEVIAKIPMTSFASMGHLLKEGSNECCAVCLGEFGEEDDKIRVLPVCSHCFHSECIDLWLYSNRSCPTCRSDLSGIGELGREPVEHITVVVDTG